MATLKQLTKKEETLTAQVAKLTGELSDKKEALKQVKADIKVQAKAEKSASKSK